MISLVKNWANLDLGYLFDNVFVMTNTLPLLSTQRVKTDNRLEGNITNELVQILSLKRNYPIISCNYTRNKDISCLDSLVESGITLQRFIFLGISKEVVQQQNLEDFWASATFPNMYQIYDTKKKETVGYLLTSQDLYNPYEVDIHICMLEILDKQKGIGTGVVKELLKYRPIRGLATKESKDFWLKVGANFTDTLHFNIK